MKTLRRRQTTAPLGLGMLSLPVTTSSHGGVVSPYFQRPRLQKIGTGRDTNISTNMLTCYLTGITPGISLQAGICLEDSVGSYNLSTNVPLSVSTSDTYATLLANIIPTVTAFLTANGVPTPDSFVWLFDTVTAIPPMLVSGVAKPGYYPVIGVPSVAGGAGVARFYIDSNGDGTGSAPSEVEIASLQAVVVNATAAYLPQTVTVDTNRKYIDIKMGFLSFSSGLAGLLNVITGASVGNAANGTVINCTVFVKQ